VWIVMKWRRLCATLPPIVIHASKELIMRKASFNG